MAQIKMTGPGSFNAIFGDKFRQYELIGSRKENESGHNFELRVLDDPNTTFMNFDVDGMDGLPPEDVYAEAVARAQEIAEPMDKYNTDFSYAAIDHMRGALKDVREEGFTLEDDFTKAVESIQVKDGQLEQ